MIIPIQFTVNANLEIDDDVPADELQEWLDQILRDMIAQLYSDNWHRSDDAEFDWFLEDTSSSAKVLEESS